MPGRTPTQRLADLTLRLAGEIGQDEVLENWVARKRDAGMSLRHIARQLDREHEIDVSEVSLRGWFDAYVAATVPAPRRRAAGGAR